jgi:DNA-binding NarL/FixJ family response regulator
MMNILIVDDHDLIREGIKKILRLESDIRISAEASSGSDVLRLLASNPIDVVLLDISMPGVSGLDLVRDIRKQNPRVAILIVSMHPEDRFAVRALRAGAAGYLTKERAGDHLAVAIRRVASGKKWISEHLAEMLAEELDHPADAEPHQVLSDREFQVFLLLARGKTVAEISEELHLGTTTVSTYRARILQKMGAASNADLIQYAYSRRLLE